MSCCPDDRPVGRLPEPVMAARCPAWRRADVPKPERCLGMCMQRLKLRGQHQREQEVVDVVTGPGDHDASTSGQQGGEEGRDALASCSASSCRHVCLRPELPDDRKWMRAENRSSTARAASCGSSGRMLMTSTSSRLPRCSRSASPRAVTIASRSGASKPNPVPDQHAVSSARRSTRNRNTTPSGRHHAVRSDTGGAQAADVARRLGCDHT